MYRQNYNPTGSVVVSTIVAAIPILVLLYCIAVHPHRDERGVRRLGIAAPVAWGAIGTPIVTLAAVSGLDQLSLSAMAGRQLPWVSMLVPFWLVVTFVKMEGGTWREAFEVWPGALVSGGSFAIVQHFASRASAFHLITDVLAGVVSVIVTALFLRFVWHPKKRFLLKSETAQEWAYR